LRIGALVLGLGVLSACDTAEDRVNAFYNRGLELVAAGEIDKAILEFRNALQLDQDSVESRLEFAKALLVKQDFQGAIGNFLRVMVNTVLATPITRSRWPMRSLQRTHRISRRPWCWLE